MLIQTDIEYPRNESTTLFVMTNTLPPADADRTALIQMFKAIAEYGRRVRQRREAESAQEEQIKQTECNSISESPEPTQQINI